MSQHSATQPTLDEAILNRWIGNSQTIEDRVERRQANFLKATLEPERDDLSDGDILPLGWHWIYCLDAPRIDRLGRDGHTAPGGFLPPVALPQRMWAGTRLRFHQAVFVGESLRKVSELVSVKRKTGRNGELCFVTVNHKYYCGRDLKLEEDHDIVYREKTTSPSNSGSPQARFDSDRSLVVTPSTTLLFRYSALTFNGHRIHYDLDFCREVEGYRGLVVHAPLTATLMLGVAEQHYAGTPVVINEFRQISLSPLFHDKPFTIHLRENDSSSEIWVADHAGQLAASAVVSLK